MAKPRISTITKKEVTERVSELTGEYAHESERWVRAVIQALGDLLVEADPEVRIEMRGFGVFEVRKVKANPRARNPRTNEPIFVPSRRKVYFRPGKKLRDVLLTPLVDLGYEPLRDKSDGRDTSSVPSPGASSPGTSASPGA